ncbi:MAG: glycoside hydrolase family 113 [Spirosomataceae bacterium]
MAYSWLWYWVIFFWAEKPVPMAQEKIYGVNWVAPSRPIGDSAFLSLPPKGIQAITLMPYAFLPPESSTLLFHSDSAQESNFQWWGETPQGIRKCIQMAQDHGLKVWLKPHVWLKNGEFTGTFRPTSWENLEESFRRYVLQYAQIGKEYRVEGIIIGTEWAIWVQERPDYWAKLIQEIRLIFPGKLTYAENWDAVGDFPHWQALDFIGVDAYFPLSSERNPTQKQLISGWKKHRQVLLDLAKENSKPILFTEFGYTDAEYTAQEPWKETDHPAAPELQARALDVLLTQFLPEPWFAGGFVWKWFPITPRRGRDRFSPQGKPAEQIIQKHYLGKTS